MTDIDKKINELETLLTELKEAQYDIENLLEVAYIAKTMNDKLKETKET